MEAKMVLVYADQREAEAVTRAVSPDNVKAPPYLFIEMFRSDGEVITRIKCGEGKFGTFTSTIDDLLSCVSVAEKAFTTIKKMR